MSKCPKCNSNNFYFDGFAGMGAFHSNYYKCYDCGYVYVVYDHNAFPSYVASKGFRCSHPDDKKGKPHKCGDWDCPVKGMRFNTEKHREYDKTCPYKKRWNRRSIEKMHNWR
jgi:hypothetical protein